MAGRLRVVLCNHQELVDEIALDGWVLSADQCESRIGLRPRNDVDHGRGVGPDLLVLMTTVCMN
jgi:hypothetical protein